MATSDFTVSFEPAPLEARVAELERHVDVLLVQLAATVQYLNELSQALAGAAEPSDVSAPTFILFTDD